MTRPDGPGRVGNVDGTDEPTPIDGDDGCENIDDLTDLEAEKERDEEQKRKAEEEDKKKEEDKKGEEKKKEGEKKEEEKKEEEEDEGGWRLDQNLHHFDSRDHSRTSVTGFAICGTAIRSSSAKPKKFFYSFHGGKKVAASARIAAKFKKWVENVESNETLIVGGEDMKMFVRQGFGLEDLLEWEGLDGYRVKLYDDEDDDNDDDEPERGYKATARKEAGEVAARQGPGGDSSRVVCPAEI
ncbi:hypothetical protein QC763_605762 [Podospora pseudopauciseta]|uniref:Uncharacterized protein n=1 Tax=Podospora pseudopauciseta TaxID=2093780 RepID=A0ABR0H3R0_9PEZI|nr:hypothetical protein QC763_605762 [Podospora pseudopauciseta]